MADVCDLTKAGTALNAWLESDPAWGRPAGSEDTNFHIPKGSCYSLPPDSYNELFTLLGECIREDTILQLMARQTETGCLLVDVDSDFHADQRPTENFIKANHCQRIAQDIAKLLRENFQMLAPVDEGNAEENFVAPVSFHIGFMQRPLPKPKGAGWRDGLHIQVFARMTKAARIWIIEEIQRKDIFERHLGPLGLLNGSDCVDKNSATVPVAIYGAESKPGAGSYKLTQLYRIEWEGNSDIYITPEEIPEEHHLPWEMSLQEERPRGLIVKNTWEPLAHVVHQLRREGVRVRAAADLEAGELEDAIERAGFASQRIGFLKGLLEIIAVEGPRRVRRADWRNILFALASEISAEFPEDHAELLARWFTMRRACAKCAVGFESIWMAATRERKGVDVDIEALRQQNVDEAALKDLAANKAQEGRCTVATIYHHARRSDSRRYEAYLRNGVSGMLRQFIYEKPRGALTENHCAKILHALAGERFVAVKDINRSKSGKVVETTRWYQLCTPSMPKKYRVAGMDWKWAEVGAVPDALKEVIVEELPKILTKFSDNLDEQINGEENPERAKAMQIINKAVCDRIAKLQSRNMVSAVLDMSKSQFLDYNFAAIMDSDPTLIGVHNGVIRMHPDGNHELLEGITPIPITQKIAVRYVKMNSDHPERVRLRRVLGEICGDSLDWILKYFSMGLVGGAKKHQFLVLLIGGGNNGKSVLLELITNLYDQYGYKAPVTLLTSGKEDPDGANSAYYSMKAKRLVYYSEPSSTKPEQLMLEMGRVKEILSPERQTTRALYGAQENFHMEALHVCSSNNDLKPTECLYAAWKRIVKIDFKRKFLPDPDPNDPMQFQEDPEVSTTYIKRDETLQALLCELLDHYLELQKHYKGNIKMVPCKSVRESTMSYRRVHDKLHKFANARALKAPGKRTSLEETVSEYLAFLRAIGAKKPVPAVAEQEMLEGPLKGYLRMEEIDGDHRRWFEGIRILKDEEEPEEGETYLRPKMLISVGHTPETFEKTPEDPDEGICVAPRVIEGEHFEGNSEISEQLVDYGVVPRCGRVPGVARADSDFTDDSGTALSVKSDATLTSRIMKKVLSADAVRELEEYYHQREHGVPQSVFG